MPSEYDALLTAAPPPSEYDALIQAAPAPTGPAAAQLPAQAPGTTPAPLVANPAPEGSPEYQAAMRHDLGQDVALPPEIANRPETVPSNTQEAYQQGGILGAAFYPRKATSLVETLAGRPMPAARSPSEQVAKGLATAPLSLLDFLTTPEGVGYAAAGGSGPILRAAMAGKFGLEGLNNTVEALKKGDYEGATQAALVAAGSAVGLKQDLATKATVTEPPQKPGQTGVPNPPVEIQSQKPASQPVATTESQISSSNDVPVSSLPQQQEISATPQNVNPQGLTEPGVSLPKPPNEEVLPNGETLTPREPATPVEQATPVSRIANRFTEERSAAGEIGEIAPGEGYSSQDLLNRGLRMSPEEVTQHVSDVVNNAGGDPKLQAAAVRAEEARLSQRSADLSRAADANPSDVQAKAAADSAFQDLTDFHNGPVAKLKNDWHAQGMALQGELPVDLSTFNGQREAWLRDTGKPPPTDVEPLLRKSARRVSDVEAQERGAMNRLGEEIDRASSKRRLVAPEELRNSIIERMKDVPCRI